MARLPNSRPSQQDLSSRDPESHASRNDVLNSILDEDDEEDAEQLNSNTEEFGDEEDDDTTGPVGDEADDDDQDDLAARQREDNDEVEKALKTKYKQDGKGNLVDGKKIIANAGKERGIFEKVKNRLIEREKQMETMAKQLGDVASAARELMGKYNALKEERGYAEKLGLDAPEAKEALELWAKSKIDPKGALRQILTKMHLAGNDLTDIGVTGPLDPTEVARHMFELQKAREPATTAPVAKDDDSHLTPVEREAKYFLRENPDAANHTQTIAAVKQRFPELSLNQIWVKLLLYWEKQKDPATQQQQQRRQEIRDTTRPIPRNASNGHHASRKAGLDLQARATSLSFNDIGRELLRDLKALED